jgi:signal transduction histidine kinase
MSEATERRLRVLLVGAPDQEDATAIETLRTAGWAVEWWSATDRQEVDRRLRAPLDLVLLWSSRDVPEPRTVFDLLRRSARSTPVVLVDSPDAGPEALELLAPGVRAVVSIDRPAQLVTAVERISSEARRQELVELTRAIGHDLNNLLAVIPLTTGSLRSRIEDASAREHLESIEHAAFRAREAVDSLYRTALWSEEGGADVRTGVALRHVIEGVARRLRSTVPSLVVETDYPANLGCVEGSPRDLRQLVLCLAFDAKRMCGGEATLRLAARPHPDERRTSVAIVATGTERPAAEPSAVETFGDVLGGLDAELDCSRTERAVSYLLTVPVGASTPRAPV